MSNLDPNDHRNNTSDILSTLFQLQDTAGWVARYNLYDPLEFYFPTEQIICPQAQGDTTIVDILTTLPLDLFGTANPNFITDIDFDNVITSTLDETELEKNDYIELKLSEQKYKNISSPDNSPCLICQEEFLNDDTVSVLGCKHIFHKDCIANWGKYRQDCPTCRHSIQFTNHTPEEEIEEIISDEQTLLLEEDINLNIDDIRVLRNNNDAVRLFNSPSISFNIIAMYDGFNNPPGQLGDDIEVITIE